MQEKKRNMKLGINTLDTYILLALLLLGIPLTSLDGTPESLCI